MKLFTTVMHMLSLNLNVYFIKSTSGDENIYINVCLFVPCLSEYMFILTR